jgi:hypothetical protein
VSRLTLGQQKIWFSVFELLGFQYWFIGNEDKKTAASEP